MIGKCLFGEKSLALAIPEHLVATCRGTPQGCVWLEQLPSMIRELEHRWLLSLCAPFDGADVSCAWVAPAVRDDGTRVVLKLEVRKAADIRPRALAEVIASAVSLDGGGHARKRAKR